MSEDEAISLGKVSTTKELKGCGMMCGVLLFQITTPPSRTLKNWCTGCSLKLHTLFLHYVFLQGLNWHLQMFTRMWDKHPLATEGNRTPQQLWMAGLLFGKQDNPDQVTLFSLLYTGLFADYS